MRWSVVGGRRVARRGSGTSNATRRWRSTGDNGARRWSERRPTVAAQRRRPHSQGPKSPFQEKQKFWKKNRYDFLEIFFGSFPGFFLFSSPFYKWRSGRRPTPSRRTLFYFLKTLGPWFFLTFQGLWIWNHRFAIFLKFQCLFFLKKFFFEK